MLSLDDDVTRTIPVMGAARVPPLPTQDEARVLLVLWTVPCPRAMLCTLAGEWHTTLCGWGITGELYLTNE